MTLQLNAPTGEVVSIDYTTISGSADAGKDYKAKSGTLTFEPGEVKKNIEIELINDKLDEPDVESCQETDHSPTSLAHSETVLPGV